MNKRIKKKLAKRLGCKTYRRYHSVRRMIDSMKQPLLSAKHLIANNDTNSFNELVLMKQFVDASSARKALIVEKVRTGKVVENE